MKYSGVCTIVCSSVASGVTTSKNSEVTKRSWDLRNKFITHLIHHRLVVHASLPQVMRVKIREREISRERLAPRRFLLHSLLSSLPPFFSPAPPPFHLFIRVNIPSFFNYPFPVKKKTKKKRLGSIEYSANPKTIF